MPTNLRRRTGRGRIDDRSSQEKEQLPMERDRYQRFVDDPKAGTGGGTVEVRVALDRPVDGVDTEVLWARPIDFKHVRLETIPAFADFLGYGDVVEVLPWNGYDCWEFVRLVKRASWTCFVKFEMSWSEAETVA